MILTNLLYILSSSIINYFYKLKTLNPYYMKMGLKTYSNSKLANNFP